MLLVKLDASSCGLKMGRFSVEELAAEAKRMMSKIADRLQTMVKYVDFVETIQELPSQMTTFRCSNRIRRQLPRTSTEFSYFMFFFTGSSSSSSPPPPPPSQ